MANTADANVQLISKLVIGIEMSLADFVIRNTHNRHTIK